VITNSTFTNNGTLSGSGGGIFMNGGTLRIVASSLVANTVIDGTGAGVFASNATTTATDSTFDGNTATSCFGGFCGGGGLHIGDGGTATIDHSAITNNQVSGGNGAGDGGGLLVSAGVVRVSNVTVTGNSTERMGGGLANYGDLRVSATTIDLNTSLGGGIGGGIGAGAPVTMVGTIIAMNQPTNCQGGPFVSVGQNLSNEAFPGSCQLVPANADVAGQDPLLNPLGNNGGPTLTQSMPQASPAIDRFPTCQDTDGALVGDDQRHVGRPLDGNGSGTSQCDVRLRGTHGVPQTPT
jgi:hypothetical protein